MSKIKGGYYLKARIIQESEIAHAPPHVREIWDWLIKEANHKDKKIHGKIIKRGQCIRSYKDIQEGLSWKIGYRKMRYSKTQVQVAMRYLTRATMITTTKTTRGMIITIVNYDRYQTPENYEIHNRSTTDPQSVHTINKNEKNEIIYAHFDQFWSAYPKKKSKGQAEKTWGKIYNKNGFPGIDVLLAAIEKQKQSEEWKKQKGQYIPHPSTWLNAKGWLDESSPTKKKVYV